MQKIIMVGAGLVGCLAAGQFAKRGFKVSVFERRSRSGTESNRRRPSINLTLCRRGMNALSEAGVLPSLQPYLAPAYGRVIHHADGRLTYQAYGKADEAIYSIARKQLNEHLLRHAESLGVTTYFDATCVDVNLDHAGIVVENNAGCRTTVDGDCVIATDGAASTVRTHFATLGLIQQTVQRWETGYATFDISKNVGGARLRDKVIHVWPRKQCMGIAFPNCDGRHTLAIHMPMTGQRSFQSILERKCVGRSLAAWFGDVFPWAENAEDEFTSQRPNAMSTVHCWPWNIGGKVLLLGDAAHAILPHLGQGANAGFEDCSLLNATLDRFGPNWEGVFTEWSRARRRDCDAIAELCKEHATTLHYEAGSEEFALRLRLERRLHELFPERIMPVYSMIAFSDMAYSDIRTRERRYRRLIDDLASDPASEQRLENEAVVEGIRAQLESDDSYQEGVGA